MSFMFVVEFRQFFSLNEESSFEYKSATKKKELKIVKKNKENPVCILWVDAILWNTYNIWAHYFYLKKKGEKEEKNIQCMSFWNTYNITKHFGKLTTAQLN